MTAIYIWPEFEGSEIVRLQAAGDSGISTGNTLSMGSGVKILTLPVICRAPGPDGFFTFPYYEHTVALAFAGSTLIAQNVYLEVMPLITNLISLNKTVPSLSEIATYIGTFVKKTWNEYGYVQGKGFEIAIFGYCHVEKKFSVALFSTISTETDGMQFHTEVLNDLKAGTYIYLGSKKSEMHELLLNEISKSRAGSPTERAPRRAIKAAIDSEDFPEISGGLQLGYATCFGYRAQLVCEPVEFGKPECQYRYLNSVMTPEFLSINENIWIGTEGTI
ncbi:hypothetical protein TKWG_13245 [Advenella kashmirensis WT001]|uniref:Uncharacterized protein n=1 Tax=Advenella kashmirensis (strain DSM 17095 / LMG 22695 / WT001) TaxID=1036672 RepID=I3UCN5_ADVKW|nr:hypothetical protein [Advenella kashmirensis]AFK62773.1 hypothetical protein TKWG_13245 [Advenella kashmirensis WT001]